MRAPATGTRRPLTVEFGEPLEQALALRLLAVTDAAGRPVEGEAVLGDSERRWGFVPAQAWAAGALLLVVPTIIEDLAGTNIGKVFDVDRFERVEKTFSTTSERLPFEVK